MGGAPGGDLELEQAARTVLSTQAGWTWWTDGWVGCSDGLVAARLKSRGQNLRGAQNQTIKCKKNT